MQSTITLTDDEMDRFNRLRPVENVAFKFWKEVFTSRGMELKNTDKTALTVRHISGPKFAVLRSDRKIKKPAPIIL